MAFRQRRQRNNDEHKGQLQTAAPYKDGWENTAENSWVETRWGMVGMLLDRRLADAANLSRRARLLHVGQQFLGNRVLQRLLRARRIQTKLTVNPPDDIYEQEADRVADAVMAMPAPHVQRQPEEEEEEALQARPLPLAVTPLAQRQEEEEEELQAKALIQRQPEEEEEEALQARVLPLPITPLMQRQEEEEEELQAKALAQRQEEEEEELQAKAWVQRQAGTLLQRENGETTTVPSTPEFRLQEPTLGGSSPPPFSEIGVESPSLTLNLVEQQLDPETVRRGLSRIEPGAPAVPSPTEAAAAAGAESPAPAVTPPTTPTPEPAPLVPAGPGPETPREASAGNVLSAIAAVPAVESTLQGLQTTALDQVRRDWDRLSTGERATAITAAVLVGGGALAGVLSHPETREMAIGMLNGQTFPVPGVRGLGVELNLRGDDWMVGFHLDVGALLPESWGFGPSSPTAIGGPPTPPERETEAEEEEEEEPVQPKGEAARTVQVTADLEAHINALRGGGQPLSAVERAFFEPRFGRDLSQVRVHSGGAAAEIAGELQAQAFTVGRDIVIGAGRYRPETPAGRQLLAHELTHVMQQGGGGAAVGRTALQFRLPPVRLPRRVGARFAYPRNLVNLVQTYRTRRDVASGRAAVAAVARWLERQGLVRYRNQRDLTAASPQFRLSESAEALAAARQTGGAQGDAAGRAFLFDSPRGRPRYQVEIYPDAFRGETANDAIGFLAGVLIHEYIHVLQFRRGGRFTEAQREFQAWLWQGENALRMGVRPNREVSLQIITFLEQYYNQLPARDRRAFRRRYLRVWRAIQPPITLGAPRRGRQPAGRRGRR